MRKICKRILSVVMVLMLAMAAFSVFAHATTVTVLDGQVSLTDSLSNMSESGGVVTVKAVGSTFSKKTNTVTITNSSTSTATLSYDYSASTYNSFSMSAASGTHTEVLAAGASTTISITSNSGFSNKTATLTLSNFSLVAAAANSQLTIEFDSTLGTVTAAGAAVESGAVVESSLSAGTALVATPASGTTFMGWTDDTGLILSTAASYTVYPSNDMTVKAAFRSTSSTTPWFGVGGTTSKTFSYGGIGGLFESKASYYAVSAYTYMFDNFEAAAQASQASSVAKVMVLLNNATLPAGNYTVPAGVTLLIPFDAANNMYTNTPQSTSTSAYVQPTAYRTLTMADGATLTVNGSLCLSAKHHAAQGAKTFGGGAPTGSVPFLRMQGSSNITVANGGSLYAWGFITGSGSVTAQSGASIYENFQIQDFRGGTYSTSDVLHEDGTNIGIFPVSQYYVQNIEVPMTIEYGAREYSFTTIVMNGADWCSSVNFFGPSDSMFNLTSGYAVKKYDGATDRLEVTLNGDMSISPLTLDMGGTDINSKDYELPINSNITMYAESGNIQVQQDVAFLPGSELTIGKNASGTLTAGVSIYVYDADQWGTFSYSQYGNKTFSAVAYAPGKTYTRTEADLKDAQIVVEGTLDGSLGYAYTTAGGANICGVEGGTVTLTPGTQAVTYQLVQGAEPNASVDRREIPLTNAKFKNADGTYRNSGTQNFTYTYTNGSWFANCDHPSYTSAVTTAAGCETTGVMTYTCVCGDAYTESIPATGHTEVSVAAVAATCTTAGKTAGTSCSVCGKVVSGQTTVAALGHTEVVDAAVPATCTATGLTEGKHCSVCSTVLVAQTEVAALGHTEVVDAAVPATCTTAGKTEGKHCSVCSEVLVAQTEVAALGHTEVVDAAVPATCTTAGKTEGKHCSVCSTVLVAQTEVAALGHTEVVDAAVPATCTATGLTEGKHCSVCSAVLVAQTEVAALGHTEVVDAAVPATCTATGLTEGKHCSVCSAVLVAQTEVAALGHTEVIDAAVPATCTATGLTEGKHCSVCSTVLVAQTEIAALGHSFNADGICENCGLVGIYAAGESGTGYYATMEEAADAAVGGYVTLMADLSGDATLSVDCYLDLNGKTLTGNITVEGDATLYLFDSATSDYTAAGRGKLVGAVTGNICRSFNTPALYGHNYKYLTIQEADGSWSAHRYYLAVKSVMLTPANATGTAVNYKTVFKCNELVAQLVSAYGAKVTGSNTVYADAIAAGMTLEAGAANEAITALVNTLSTEYTGEVNAANALAAPTVNAYIVVDGLELTSVGVTQSLQELLVAANARTDLSFAEKAALGWMYTKFQEIIDAWEVDLSAIKSYAW